MSTEDKKSQNSNAMNLRKKAFVGREKKIMPKMISFQRPFRKLVKSAAAVSVGISLVHAHCWSRTLSIFKIRNDDGAGIICTALFSPLATQSAGAEEKSIWIIWGIIMLVMLVSFLHNELNGKHCRSEGSFSIKLKTEKRLTDDINLDEYLDYSSDSTDASAEMIESPKRGSFSQVGRQSEEVPQETLPMVPWLSLFAVHSLIDVFLQLKVFLGRVDARLMQPALEARDRFRPTKKIDKNEINDPRETFKYMQNQYPGCLYDYSLTQKTVDGKGFWFDFMADCGDGFNSSYQVARLLAQQNISVRHNKVEKTLPRGDFLVLGGDLAYPQPTERNYEKRFFRIFEDAMSPPPSFRRSKIATNKQNICVKGWKQSKCFDNIEPKNANEDDHENVHENYTGPSTFIVPGNHDWYDGLATFTRFILCRDFLGGWLMPQQRSYFVIKLKEGWWIFGLDCALAADIDIEQFKFFVDIADNVIGDSDSIILVNHEPHWVTDSYFGKEDDELSERNISELMEQHLRGKVRARLAGDLHHYTRHVPTNTSNGATCNISRSLSLDGISKIYEDSKYNLSPDKFEPFIEENKPDLIVSGGGGAFLHGTNAFERDIKVGPKRQSYTRVCAYPNEKISSYLGWLIMYHFRWRGWRCDLVFALLYLGIGMI